MQLKIYIIAIVHVISGMYGTFILYACSIESKCCVTVTPNRDGARPCEIMLA